ncbi:MAG: hypothetical protein ACI3XP_06265 [Eubacteriales bacterium]
MTGKNLPRLEWTVSDRSADFHREKDVENKLIKPLLAKLGYSEADYEQQLYMEIGNHNHALIPDFVMLPIKEKGRQSAFALIEAKLSVSNRAQLAEVKVQARSYARLLNVKYASIASKEKIWVLEPGNDLNFEKEVFEATWDELENPDAFSQLRKLIGMVKNSSKDTR